MADIAMQSTQEKQNNTGFTMASLLLPWCYAGSDQALKKLVRAVIVQAGRDARNDDLDGQAARAWLLGEDCPIYAEFVGLDYNAIRAWVMAGCIIPSRRNGASKGVV